MCLLKDIIIMTLNPESPVAKVIFENLSLLRSNLLIQIANRRGGTLTETDAINELFEFNEDSRAQKNTALDLELALNEHEIFEIRDIDAALAHLKSGLYGLCIECSELIAPKRLSVTPQVIRCLACQKKLELKMSSIL